MDKINKIILVFIILTWILYGHVLYNHIVGCKTFRMFNLSQSFKYGVDGYYYEDEDNEFYCVWVKGKSPEKIKKSECHEYLHYLISHDYEHFCQENYVSYDICYVRNGSLYETDN